MSAEAVRTFEFWLGRAGSGKTRACLDAIAEHLIAYPRGKPLLFLVPEQASASMEQALEQTIEAIREARAKKGDATGAALVPGGFTRARILTFRLLREEVFSRVGGRPRNIVNEQSRILLLRRVIRRNRDALRIFGGSAELPGLASSVHHALGEFQRYGWRREDLQLRVEQMEGDDSSSEVLLRKLQDLSLIWAGYAEALHELGFEDLPALNEAAAARVREWDFLEGAHVWIDGFASFTEEESSLLDALLERAGWSALALCLNPFDPAFIKISDPKAAIGSQRPRIGPQRAFEILEQTYVQMRSRLRDAGWHTRDQFLPIPGLPTRFSRSPSLEVLEREILTGLGVPAERNAGWPAAGSSTEWPSGPIELLEAPNRRAEVEAVARRIAALRAKMRPCPHTGHLKHDFDWSEILVLVRDLEPYAPLVREIFPRYGLPFFIDQVRSLSRHPLARLLLAVLRAARAGWTTDLALDYLKTGLTPLADLDTIAEIERLASQRRLLGQDWSERNKGDKWLASRHRETPGEVARAERLFNAWREAARPADQLRADLEDGSVDSANALWKFLDSVHASERLDAWIQSSRDAGDEELASIHERAWKHAVDILDSLHDIASRSGDPTMESRQGRAALAAERIDELEELLESALQSVRGRLVPPIQEQILVGAVDRSRSPLTIRAAFVMGLADGEFPRVYDEDPVLGDRERDTLRRGARSLGPDSAQKFAQERFFAYIALTRASECLVASRPLQDDGGRALQPSSPFRALAEAFPAAGPHATQADEPDGSVALPERPERWTSRITSDFHLASAGNGEALDRLLRRPHPLEVIPASETRSRSRAARTLEALAWPRHARLTPELSREFWMRDPALSATGLEAYGACPFKFFAARVLRLERRLELTPGPLEMGELRHAILEALFRRLGGGAPLDWGGVDVKNAARLIDEIAPEIAEQTLEDRFGRDSLTLALLAEAVEDMKIVVRVLRIAGERYGFAQVDAEYRLGSTQHEPLRIPAAPGLDFLLRGSIDRVDAERGTLDSPAPNLVLFDFKSGAQAAQHSAARYYHGLSLQLAIYGLALRRDFSPSITSSPRPASRGRSARISGFFYWPLSVGLARETATEAESVEPATPAWFKSHSAKGLFDASIAPSLDTAIEPGASALAFKFSMTRTRALSRQSFGALAGRGFDLYLDYVESLVRERAAEIAGGRIEVRPLASPVKACDLCDYAPVCRVASSAPDVAVALRPVTAVNFREQFGGDEMEPLP